MAVTNLNSYYTALGQRLPSVTERAGTFSSLGLGTGYAGTADQNNKLLSALQKRGTAAAPSPAPSSAAPVADTRDKFLTDFNTGIDSLLASQRNEQEGLFKQFETKQAGQEKLTDAYKRISGETGLKDARTNVAALRQRLDTLDSDVSAKTKGTFTTEGERGAMVDSEGKPLALDLNRNIYMEGVASQETGTMLDLLKTDQQNELTPIQMRIEAFSDRAARETTGYTTKKQNELNLLTSKIQRQEQLDDREWETAHQLAAEERAFSQQKELLKIQNGFKTATDPGTAEFLKTLQGILGGTAAPTSSTPSAASFFGGGQPKSPVISLPTGTLPPGMTGPVKGGAVMNPATFKGGLTVQGAR